MGQVVVKVDGDRIRLNKRFYNPDNYSVIIAMDSGNNLPATLRRYIATVSGKPALVVVFSRPYMMRDYYLNNIDKLWIGSQIERIPVEDGTKKDVAQRILVKANAGGITRKEVLRLAKGIPEFADFAEKDDLDSILRAVLELYGASQEKWVDLYHYFEYSTAQRFDEDGKYDSEERIILRRQGKLFDMINGRDMVVMVVGDEEITLPLPRSRLTQNFITGQNLVHNGNIYHILKMDTEAGRIYARLAVGGMNDEVYQYVQDREYTVEMNPELVESVTTKHLNEERAEDDVKISDIYVSSFRAPMEVVTRGFHEVDPHTLTPYVGMTRYQSISDPGNDTLAKQNYRRYGQLTTPTYSSETVMKQCQKPTQRGAAMLSIRLSGEFGPNMGKTLSLAAVMLGEVLRSMFPSVADSLVVCPVLPGEPEGEDAKRALKWMPRLKVIGESELISHKDFSLVIIEDCANDLGVISILMSAGNNILQTLFTPICNYLLWNAQTDKPSDYLNCGLDHTPDCFDFEALTKLAKLLGDDKHDNKFVNLESVMEYESCDFCGKRYTKGEELVELDDGRKMCKACAGSLVGNNKKILKAHLERAKTYLESTYGITLDDGYDFCFESTVKIVNTLKQNQNLLRRGADAPLKSYIDSKRNVHIEHSIPSANLSELLVRELTHVWQRKHLPELSEEMAEGHIALVGIQYMRFLNHPTIAAARTNYFETADTESGMGYRKLVRALLENPQYKNNPFLYLLEKSGAVVEEGIAPTPPRVVAEGDYGLPYTPAQPDRILDGQVPYFHYPRLTATCQQAYDQMLEAIRNHQESFMVSGCDMETMGKVKRAVTFDHPELFWFDNFGMDGARVVLYYGATAEEVAVLQKRIDEAAAKYLEGIDDSMSAYDVALRLHVKMINSVDYDTVALEREEKAGGPADGKIDYLRSICGVFLNGKAVCEGYARAMQYLLQKCGVECAEMAGDIHKENGENGGGHAWNILKVDGDYYYLDTTWDDSSSTIQSVKNTNLGFDYFCITTDELTRTRDLKFCPTDAPVCDATRANYYYHNDAVLESYDLNKIKTIAQTAATNKSKFFTFKCKTKALFEDTLQRLCADGQDCFDTLRFAAKADKRIVEGYTYSYDKNLWTITVYFKYK